MLFLAHMLNRPVVDAAGVRLGWVEDLILSGLDLFPRIEAIVLARRGRGAVFVPWTVVDQVHAQAVHLRQTRDQLPTSPLNEEAVFLRRDILDKQVVDINGRRVVRVNDLQLAAVNHDLRLIGADIGVRGLLRRLNLERPANAVAKTVNAPLPERVIPWNYVEGIATDWPSVRLNVTHRRLRELPATDIADIIAQLNPDDRDELLLAIDDETVADTLPHLEEDMQAEVILAMTDQRASDIMEILPPDEAADVLGDISEERAERILHLMEPEEAEDVRELLRYDDETAGGRMTTEYFALAEQLTVGDALTQLRREAPDSDTVYYLYLTDDAGRLQGVLSLRDLITSPEDTPVAEVERRDVIRVHVDDDQETVARTLTRYHLLAVPVVDDAGMLVGIVTIDDVLDVLHEEAEEDISRQAGAMEESDTMASPWQQATLRLPWALGSALTGMLIALYLTSRFYTLPEVLNPLLAIMPLLVLLGVQISGQCASAMQVGLAEGDDLHEIILRLSQQQWPVGVGLSLLGAVIGAMVTFWLGSLAQVTAVGAVIGGVLLLNLAIGTLLPLLLSRLRWDPALVSRPALAVLALVVGVPLVAQVLR